MEVHSVYMAAVCERERESMPVVGVAKDRQVLRGLNAVLPKVQSMMCFGCAQIRAHVPLWQRMHEPGQIGLHKDPEKAEHKWNENYAQVENCHSVLVCLSIKYLSIAHVTSHHTGSCLVIVFVLTIVMAVVIAIVIVIVVVFVIVFVIVVCPKF